VNKHQHKKLYQELTLVIDVFCHHSSKLIEEIIRNFNYRIKAEDLGKKWTPQSEFPFPVGSATAEFRLKLMDKYGIDMQALSQTAPALFGIEAEMAAEICRRSNDENYELCKVYPKRFVNICIVSLLDVEAAMEELDRSVNELGCRGITIATNQNGKGLDFPDYFRFYEKLAEHDLPLLLHPTYWESYPLADQVQGWGFMAAFGWPFDTTQAVWRLILGGVLDRFPSLKIVTHHMGALFPYFSGRMHGAAARNKPARDISEYWKNIFGDTAMSGGTTAAYELGYEFFGPDRLMFGSDYPFGPEAGERSISATLAGIRSMNIPLADKEKILGKNAEKLLKVE
jgi:predicted TIM-barrel fold metal-dependent hydrolase